MNPSASAQILIVDDTPTNIIVLAGMLEPDYAASFAASGPEALAMLDAGVHPDLILLDIMMPDMDGYEVCETLKRDPATRDIPVIFVTARTDAESETRALTAGGVDFIYKPVNKSVMLTRVRLHLELRRQTRALQLANAELARHRDHLEELVHARTRELAEARDAAESASRAKSAFLATVSHELRTPMNQILGIGHLLARQSADPLTLTRLSQLQQSARELLDLINEIIDYSKSEAERIQLEQRDFALERLLERATRGVLPELNRKGLELVRRIDPALPAWLRGDPRRIEQILASLLSNAVKFSDQGRIGLELRQTESRNDRVTLRFEVADQGIGIAPDIQAGLFQSFKPGDESLSRRYRGAGLGLALSRRLVTLMGGEIGFESAPGQGSRFWFTVPLPVGHDPRSGPDGRAAIDWTQAAAAVSDLDRLLAASDCDALILWTGMRAQLDPVLGERLPSFEQALDDFDLETALTLLRAAVAETPELSPERPRAAGLCIDDTANSGCRHLVDHRLNCSKPGDK